MPQRFFWIIWRRLHRVINMRSIWDIVTDLGGILPKGRPNKATELPPFNENFTYFILLREQYDEEITVLQPTGNSFVVSVEELERYLSLYMLDGHFISRLLSYLWNFYSVVLDIEHTHFQHIPVEEVIDEKTGKLRLPDVVLTLGVG